MNLEIISQSINSNYIWHHNISYWGESICIMRKDGSAFARLSQYNNDFSTVYLDSLSVNVEKRNKGIGTELQQMRENIGKALGAKKSILAVERNSWMIDWYKRRKYVFYQGHDESNLIWMIKTL